jgi:hypothetical protein
LIASVGVIVEDFAVGGEIMSGKYKCSAVFVKTGSSDVQVFYREDEDERRSLVHMETLEPCDQFGYEGEFVFCLAAARFTEQVGPYIHIPLNVLRAIAEYKRR